LPIFSLVCNSYGVWFIQPFSPPVKTGGYLQ
jgi:hypothetical protein